MSYKKNYQKEISENNGGFHMLPNSIYDLELLPSRVLTFSYLVSNSEVWHSPVGEIVMKTGLSKSTVRNSLKQLEIEGMIRKVRKATHKEAARYEIRPPSQWVKSLPSGVQNIALSGSINAPVEGQNVPTSKKTSQEEHNTENVCANSEIYESMREKITQANLNSNIYSVPKIVSEYAADHGDLITLSKTLELVARHAGVKALATLTPQIEDALKLGHKNFNENTIKTFSVEDHDVNGAERNRFLNSIGAFPKE